MREVKLPSPGKCNCRSPVFCTTPKKEYPDCLADTSKRYHSVIQQDVIRREEESDTLKHTELVLFFNTSSQPLVASRPPDPGMVIIPRPRGPVASLARWVACDPSLMIRDRMLPWLRIGRYGQQQYPSSVPASLRFTVPADLGPEHTGNQRITFDLAGNMSLAEVTVTRIPADTEEPVIIGILVNDTGRADAPESFSDGIGEILPLQCKDEPLFVWQPLAVIDALDKASSNVRRFKNCRIMRIRRHVFVAARIEGVEAFKIPDLRVSPIFFSEHAVQVISAAVGPGLEFNAVWSSRDEEPNHRVERTATSHLDF